MGLGSHLGSLRFSSHSRFSCTHVRMCVMARTTARTSIASVCWKRHDRCELARLQAASGWTNLRTETSAATALGSAHRSRLRRRELRYLTTSRFS
jgi:hypothetical protein